MLTGLQNPIHTSQQIFRAILKAMGEPTTIVDIAGTDAWEALNPASVGVLLTLCDQNTNVYFSNHVSGENVTKSTQFHTQAVVGDAASAHFAFVQVNEFNADYEQGNEVCPEHAATVVIQVESLTEGRELTFSGPGIQNTTTASPVISDALLAHYQRQAERYPLGIDTILTCGIQLMAIPRTTKIQEAQSCT